MIKFSDIEDAFFFVSSARYGEHSAIVCKTIGEMYYSSVYGDIDDEFPEDEFDPKIHIRLPHKNDLELGKPLVFEFVEQYLPDEYDYVNRIFRKRGAYARWKDLLDSKGFLETWYEFENQRVKKALQKWCQDNDIHLTWD